MRPRATVCMATALIEPRLTRLGHALSLAVWWCGWLMLGELGRKYAPLAADGVAPLAVWLCSMVASMRLMDLLGSSPSRLSNLIVVEASVTTGALVWASIGGGAAAVLLAAAFWGMLVVAVDRAARALDGPTRRLAADIPMAGVGAVMAWTVSGRGVWGAAGLIAPCGLCLAWLCRRAGGEDVDDMEARRCMPQGWACLLGADGDWIVRCTRAAMVPMMASLMFSSEWCVGAGSTERTTAVGIHLASMFLLPCLLSALGVRLATVWLALPMGASAVFLVVLPGADGLMAASATQSVAWGLSYVAGPKPALRANSDAAVTGWGHVLAVIAAVTALGIAGVSVGPIALSSAQAALGIGVVALALASINPLAAAPVWRRP